MRSAPSRERYILKDADRVCEGIEEVFRGGNQALEDSLYRRPARILVL